MPFRPCVIGDSHLLYHATYHPLLFSIPFRRSSWILNIPTHPVNPVHRVKNSFVFFSLLPSDFFLLPDSPSRFCVMLVLFQTLVLINCLIPQFTFPILSLPQNCVFLYSQCLAFPPYRFPTIRYAISNYYPSIQISGH